MTVFYGKCYRYKDEVFGIIPTPNDGVCILGHIVPLGGLNRMEIFPVFNKADETQRWLDEYAKLRGLAEVRA